NILLFLSCQNRQNYVKRGLRNRIDEHEGVLAVSAATIYETITLARKNRITLNRATDDWIERATRGADIEIIPLDASIAWQAGNLPFHHGDPIDRLIIASVVCQNSLLASMDSQFRHYEALVGRLITNQG
ncbi:MAG: type II toxin-antitoxin system VapC family toxin, partial [Magnetococcales bacterium]|nr:type II toxin-antitoxin system VapC family toxin [Magnetococcales bacterium]